MYFREVTDIVSDDSTDSMSRSKRLKVAEPKRYEKAPIKFSKPIYIETWNARQGKWQYDRVEYKFQAYNAMNDRAVELLRERMKNDDE